MRCQLCDKEVDLPFRCSYCQGYFCIDHKLPENHQCPELPKLKSFPHPMESKSVWEPEPEPKQEPEKPKQKLKTALLAFCIILIIVGATAAYTSYNFGYNIGSDFAYNKGYETGYVRGVTDGAGRGYNIRDPTYQEALSFIASDHTEQHQYGANYTCFDFTADFKANAFKAGYKCGFVYVEFLNASHAIVAFNTTDHGLIFMEPQFDNIVTLILGQLYSGINNYELPDYDDTIVRFVIIW